MLVIQHCDFPNPVNNQFNRQKSAANHPSSLGSALSGPRMTIKLRSRLSFQVSFYPFFEVFLAKGQAKGRLTLNVTNFKPGSPAMLLEQ